MDESMSDAAADAARHVLERRAMLRGIVAGGAVAAVASALAACGEAGGEGGEASSGSPQPSAATTSSKGGGSTKADEVLVATSEVPEGGGVILTDPQVVVTQPATGDFACFSSICTHAGCPVADVSEGTINCTCHGSQYSIEDGSVVTGPATAPLPPIDIKVTGDSVTLA
jgi:Rieske Fe-S protein